MDENDWLAARSEEQRAHLRSVAYRMLGSLAEADDAVQDSWLRLSSADAADVENLGGWLTTVVSRECLRMLCSRRGRREHPLADVMVEPPAWEASDPEARALLADSVGPALMVVLDTLARRRGPRHCSTPAGRSRPAAAGRRCLPRRAARRGLRRAAGRARPRCRVPRRQRRAAGRCPIANARRAGRGRLRAHLLAAGPGSSSPRW
jgi:hypothetical protein